MTYAWYGPTGSTFEKRMDDIIDRRALWLEKRPATVECIVIVPKSEAGTVGFWLSHAGIAWGVLTAGRVSVGSVGFTEDRDGLEVRG